MVFSGMATGEALWEVAAHPVQSIGGLTALFDSPQARAQLGEAVLAHFNADLRVFKDAYEAGDWQTAGQAAGKITTDFALVAGGVGALARLGVTTAQAGGRLLLGVTEDLALGRMGTSAGPQVRTAGLMNAGGTAGVETSTNSVNGAKLNNQLTSQAITDGHTFRKHIGEFSDLGIKTEAQFQAHVERVINNATNKGSLNNGRTYFYDANSNTIVIKNPNAVDGGTAFRIDTTRYPNPINYINTLR